MGFFRAVNRMLMGGGGCIYSYDIVHLLHKFLFKLYLNRQFVEIKSVGQNMNKRIYTGFCTVGIPMQWNSFHQTIFQPNMYYHNMTN